ncbi:hypothetical protein COLO4_34672 [Corchorus olitorius]|uniref:Uncharacterized protein n=1 Tax=Corchorus olitorius TaxID=93759 RepID=A0A1R3GK03_9ROSI|nr:hypothetical protein COLO4_34672 [Corchorus olitorius]
METGGEVKEGVSRAHPLENDNHSQGRLTSVRR